eukprot:1156326-Pelagomonas_calceolata.AAC.2
MRGRRDQRTAFRARPVADVPPQQAHWLNCHPRTYGILRDTSGGRTTTAGTLVELSSCCPLPNA